MKIKMRAEIPVFTKCCFCFPLRYGLLVWGYIKLTADAFAIALWSYSIMRNVLDIRATRKDDDFLARVSQDMILPVLVVAYFLLDLLVTIAFIIGVYKKNVRPIRAFYYISIVMWIFTLLLTVTAIVVDKPNFKVFDMIFWITFISDFSIYFLALGVQTYIIFLLKSEIVKLNNVGETKIVKNAAEAESTMKCEDVAAKEDTEIETV